METCHQINRKKTILKNHKYYHANQLRREFLEKAGHLIIKAKERNGSALLKNGQEIINDAEILLGSTPYIVWKRVIQFIIFIS